ncbi:hypothetical protein ETAA8_32310 [Anatilimnocola aggregata]|uniref:Uncharacterized protein n=1 Tax=Anatilimnocola aggregata TaxID=2528021 RepID=A0A517YD18_9BACT|nr:hypothetical protein [Anatilimnocola aggregata]QDU28131.1 hypothetical protein ETAA8_32310 [Anatilimnocola aggregata]
MTNALHLSDRITLVPVLHGSGDFAIAVRRLMLEQSFDCLAVPLPPSFQPAVEQAIGQLPTPTAVLQKEQSDFFSAERNTPGEHSRCSYVPIDPCQAVIAALRSAIAEHLPRAFIDLETNRFEPPTAILPDAYALKKVSIEQFAAATLPSTRPPQSEQHHARIIHMAAQLRTLELKRQRILAICSLTDWPWLRNAYREKTKLVAEDDAVSDPETYAIDPATLIFLLGELPFITQLYERARAELEDDENLSIDGIKELLLVARDRYRADFKRRARKITPHLLKQCLKYLRNLSLVDGRLTPDLYNLIVATQQTCGDAFAVHVAETARDYELAKYTPFETIKCGISQARLPDKEIVELDNRLPGHPIVWRTLQLTRKPKKPEKEEWLMRWNPYSQCSWPPEDQQIETFRAHLFDRAKAVMGADLARTEPFTTSIMDGVDIRDTLRHWYEEKIYVKILPPSRGRLDCVVMLFDAPADPRDYPWRATWFAEHQEESTLAFFASDFSQEMVGPGIGLSTYGGAMFLFPPIHIPDIWTNRELDFTSTLEERLLAAACLHSSCPQIALLSASPPGAGWRRLAQRFGKKFVHLPLNQFSDATIQQLRMVHVLNGKQVRSYAEHFIRKA